MISESNFTPSVASVANTQASVGRVGRYIDTWAPHSLIIQLQKHDKASETDPLKGQFTTKY